MIDFKNGKYLKLKKTGKTPDEIFDLLIPDEMVISTYMTIRDYIVFTNKRVIAVNVQGLTGKKKDYTTLPYSKIQAFSIETSEVFDLDSELQIYFSGLGRVDFEFTGASDIVEIGKTISEYTL